jgi:DNA-binding transcriptional LysR family regulator
MLLLLPEAIAMPFKVTLSQLDAFRSVARTLSYARAAEQLGYSESAVHQQVHALEQTLGLKLFSARKHRIQLSDTGQALLQSAEGACVAVAEFERVAVVAGREARSEVVVAASNQATGFLLQQMAAQFRAKYPGIQLRFHISISHGAIAGLIDGSVDVGIIAAIPGPSDARLDPGPSFDVVSWIADEWVLAKAPGPVPATVFYHPLQAWVLSRMTAASPTGLIGGVEEYVPLDTLAAVKSATLGRLGYGLVPGISVGSEVERGLLDCPIATGVRHDLLLLLRTDASPSARLVRDFLLSLGDPNLSDAGQRTGLPAALG